MKIVSVMFLLILMTGFVQAQTEVNPTDIKFNNQTKLEFNSPHLDISSNSSFGSVPLIQFGDMRFLTSGRHRFFSGTTGTPLMNIEFDIDGEGKITRPSTGTSDLLPYAYGTVCKAVGISLTVEDDSGNFSATSGASYLQIDFNDNVAEDIVFVFSPYSCGGLTQATQGSARPFDANSTRVTMYQPNGSNTSEMGISFVAYKK